MSELLKPTVGYCNVGAAGDLPTVVTSLQEVIGHDVRLSRGHALAGPNDFLEIVMASPLWSAAAGAAVAYFTGFLGEAGAQTFNALRGWLKGDEKSRAHGDQAFHFGELYKALQGAKVVIFALPGSERNGVRDGLNLQLDDTSAESVLRATLVIARISPVIEATLAKRRQIDPAASHYSARRKNDLPSSIEIRAVP